MGELEKQQTITLTRLELQLLLRAEMQVLCCALCLRRELRVSALANGKEHFYALRQEYPSYICVMHCIFVNVPQAHWHSYSALCSGHAAVALRPPQRMPCITALLQCVGTKKSLTNCLTWKIYRTIANVGPLLSTGQVLRTGTQLARVAYQECKGTEEDNPLLRQRQIRIYVTVIDSLCSHSLPLTGWPYLLACMLALPHELVSRPALLIRTQGIHSLTACRRLGNDGVQLGVVHPGVGAGPCWNKCAWLLRGACSKKHCAVRVRTACTMTSCCKGNSVNKDVLFLPRVQSFQVGRCVYLHFVSNLNRHGRRTEFALLLQTLGKGGFTNDVLCVALG
jgi:hypothetical protein